MFQDLILRGLRWLLVILFIIGGVACAYYADQMDSMKPVLPAIVSFGAAFVLTAIWKDLRRKILFATIVLVVGLAFVAQYFSIGVYLVTGQSVVLNYFVAWTALVAVVGVPVMMFVFNKFGE